MIPSNRRIGIRLGVSICRCDCVLLVAVLVAALAQGNVAQCGEVSPIQEAIEPSGAIASDSVREKGRRTRELRSASSDGTERSNLNRRQRKRVGRGKHLSQSGDQIINGVSLRGSFEVGLGGHLGTQRQGSIDVQFDQVAVDQLSVIVGERIDDAIPVAKGYLSTIVSLPEILKSTGEILERLSDPGTQRSLRQVEQLLRLMQPSPEQ